MLAARPLKGAGDTVFVRGGTYNGWPNTPVNGYAYMLLNNIKGTATSPCVFMNYPGESPVFDFTGVVISSTRPSPTGLSIFNTDYLHFKGIRFTGLKQILDGSGVSRGLELNNCNWCVIEQVEIDHFQGTAFFGSGSVYDCTFKNCDAHHNDDRLSANSSGVPGSDAWDNADGFGFTGAGNTSDRITFDGCRAWLNCDDGWDNFGTNGSRTWKNCWAFWNGYYQDPGMPTKLPAGNGQGFKLGPLGQDLTGTDDLRVLQNCVGFENRAHGFDQNGEVTTRMKLLNCTAYGNGGYGFQFQYYPSTAGVIPHTFKNNASLGNGSGAANLASASQVNISNNSWNGGVTITTADFSSLSSIGADGPRQADGSLPNLTFIKLASSSDLINAGTNVGLPFNSTAPDLGAYEFGTANSPANQVPTANANIDQTISLPISTVTLSGSGTDPDGTISSYAWAQVSGPTTAGISSNNLATTTVTALTQGIYKFELTVTDNSGATDRDTVQVTVNPAATNLRPNANAGSDQAITLPLNLINLAGSGTDPDGTITGFFWTKISGPSSGIIGNALLALTTVTGLVSGVYKFELKVTDNNGATDTDTMQLTVNDLINLAPVATAGTDQTITLPLNSVSLNGSGSDIDGTISNYSWAKISGPATGSITNANTATTTATSLVQGVYQFQLTVTDNDGATSTDIVQVTVNAAANQAPTANAGTDQNITLPINAVSLNGSGTDPDGTITSYRWRKIAGPTSYSITSTTSAITSATGLLQGVYKFELKVTDNNGATGADTIQVTVNAAVPVPNEAPVGNAGNDQTITLPINSASLNGSATDPDGTISSYSWAQISGPATSTITNVTTAVTTATGLVEGVYQFKLTVTDNDGATDTDTVTVTVNPEPNHAPVSNAGTSQSITLPTNVVSLNGSGTDTDGTIDGYSWAQVSGPSNSSITNPAAAATTVTGLTEGVYQFSLTVTDNDGATDTDIIQVTVNAAAPQPNELPTANAGPDQAITLPTNSVVLTGSGVDFDGTITAYRWRKISGPFNYSISSTTNATTSVTGLAQGIYRFELRVTDNNGATDRDTIQVTVNPAPNQLPTANAGLDKTITLPTNSVTLLGTGTDPDGNISAYSWTKISGPASGSVTNAGNALTSASGLVEGVYQFELKVTDNSGATDRDTMKVTVNPAPNQAPTANAGNNQTITLPTNTVTLTGSGTDADGTISAYSWTKISGPSGGSISNTSSASTSVTGLVQGVYQFELKVTDNDGATDTDIMQVNVNAAPNVAPTANAGSDKVITLPTNSTSLNGSGTDTDGSIVGYLWRKISGPANGTITNTNSANTNVTGLVQGTYRLELKVTDNNGATGRDTVQVTVNAAPNQLPTANAGFNQTITLPTNTVTLSGSGTDPDGTISSYVWTKISGPSSGTISNSFAANTSVTGLVQGVYEFELTVTDDDGGTGIDIVQVTVNAVPNQAPTANAGSNLVITLPTNSVSLSGSGTDPDGTITNYLWRKISGPAGSSITNTSVAVTSVTGLVQGVYQFELKVTDDDGATDTDTVQVTVNEAPNQGPTANAGSNLNITLPTNTVSLSGSGTDPDGTITAYQWIKISGPASSNITNAAAAVTSVTGLTQGVYQFKLIVTDNDGATDTDTVQVTVNEIPNIAPTANAGLDHNITLPTNSASLNGSGTDPDGTITAYLWRKISGPASGSITNTAAAVTTVTGLTAGVYKFELKVTDNDGATDTDTMQVNVNSAINQLPTANAGLDQNIMLPTSTVTMNGSGTDPDGIISAYLWRKVSGPATGIITNTAAANTTITGLTLGVYKFELKVTDNSGSTDLDTMQVTVNAAINQLPTSNAGSDLVITLPTNSVSFNGSGIDPDGIISVYLWRKISGPTAGTITNTASATTSATSLVQGIYKFELKVTDNSGATDLDTMQVTVNPAVNQAPIANAGLDKNITLPTNAVALTGSGTDPDGTIAAYLWTKISGPTGGTITSPTAATTSVTALIQGIYKYELKVTDNSGATDRDTMQVTVNIAANLPPTANAGLDKNITLPTNSVSLTGSGTDPDGTIAAYLWRKISGPASADITSTATASTTVTALVPGVYKFELKVTDNSGASDTDTMQVTVNDIVVPVNQAPIANAGSDTTIYLPDDAVVLSGSGVDPDGTIVSYSWNWISGGAHTLSNSNDPMANLSNLQQGVYEFELTVTDNNGATGKDTVQIAIGAARIQAADVDDVTIMGNPVESVLNLKISSFYINKHVLISLFDIRGNLLIQKEIYVTQHTQLEAINVSKFLTGEYFLKVNFTPKTGVVKKVIKR